MSDDIVTELRHGSNPCRIEPKCVRCRGADEIERLRRERAHSVGCEHSVDPPHRCSEETCYRQWQADEIERLRAALTEIAEFDRDRQVLSSVELARIAQRALVA